MPPHPYLDDIQKAVGKPPNELGHPESRFAAVSAVFTHARELLFIKRAEYAGDPWSGHISFPGGRVEPDDPTPLAAAKRETMEELSLDLGGAEVLGQLDDLPTISGLPRMIIRPFVFAVPDVGVLRPNAEVAGTHLLSIDFLLSNEGRGSFLLEHRERRMTLPCVDFEGQRLWGITLLFVDDLLDRLDGGGRGMARIPSMVDHNVP